MEQFTTVKGLMTKKVVTVTPETPLANAVDLLVKRGLNGLPVVNADGSLAGILTEYDLMIRGSSIYLPTFLKLLQGFEIYRTDKSSIRDDIKKIAAMRVKDTMNAEPLVLRDDAPVQEAIKAFSEHHRVNPIPVVSAENKLVGIISRSDLIRLMGVPSVHLAEGGASTERELDKRINTFMSDFERQFILVSRFRTRYWILFSILFAIVGFIIAFALIVRIQ
jgi:CBS domain-containing protein